MVRVAAVQLASGTNVDDNLATCLRMIDQAAQQQPELMVLPEFCNHISWYDDSDHAWRVALELEGSFLQAVADKALQHKSYIVINVSVRREGGQISVSSLLYGPDGDLLTIADKQTLMGHENDFFIRAEQSSPVAATPFGRLGIFPCRDGVTFETPRCLALEGAQLFCDSLNSFAVDEAALHVPARAPENKVFLVAANKVGPLIPEALLEAVSTSSHIPVQYLMGAGESQVVDPQGRVLARAPRQGEAVVIADIDLSEADNKQRPDGTDSFSVRRPECYQAIVQPPTGPYTDSADKERQVALMNPVTWGSMAITELVSQLEALPQGIKLVVVPELFCIERAGIDDIDAAALLCDRAIDEITRACTGKDLQLCTSLLIRTAEGPQLQAVLISAAGVIASQPLLHKLQRHSWSSLGNDLQLFDLGWAKVAMLCGDDASMPEIVKVAALKGVHVLLVPFDLQEPWQSDYGLLSRAAENRICIVAASRESAGRGGLIASLERDFTIMTPWQERSFDGNINWPIVTRQCYDQTETIATIHPDAAKNKLMSANTDLLADRPWRLSNALVSQ